ncbi:MAG TPA: hypothetical protein VFR86_22325 [Burkholderiaceae bacterium]|nr:hypothetical protein [Burkholderiaceae bacterium]
MRDDDGASVFAARVEDVDVETMAEALTALRAPLELQHPEWHGAQPRAAALRAAALLAQALVPLRTALEAHAARLAPPPARIAPDSHPRAILARVRVRGAAARFI